MKKLFAVFAGLTLAIASQATILFQDTFDSYAASTEMNATGGWFTTTNGSAATGIGTAETGGGANPPAVSGVRLASLKAPLTAGSLNRMGVSVGSLWAVRPVIENIMVLQVDFFRPSTGGAAVANPPIASVEVRNGALAFGVEMGIGTYRGFATNGTTSFTGSGTFAEGAWNRVRVFMDTQSGTTTLFVNNTLVGARTDAYMVGFTPNVAQLVVQPSVPPGQGIVYMDNFQFESVPEPMTMTVLALMAGALKRRKKAKKG